MSERTNKFSEELRRLLNDGLLLENAMKLECIRGYKEHLEVSLGNDKEKLEELISKLPNFRRRYQKWYSEAQAVVKQVLPDRLEHFNSYFDVAKNRKEITYENYRIRDYLQGLRVTRGYEKEVVVDASAAVPAFDQQLNILRAAEETLDSKLMDLKGVLQADLFDSEVDSARALAKAGYLRATGAICGVVIEKHLTHVCDVHGLTVKKKSPGISDLSQLLRDEGITTVPQWRFIQHLADIRNLCDHAKGREPKKEEIDDLLAGTEKVLKTVF
ncbi:hypothetical protein [Sinorhizobium meliloti]|uniref:hypothetical protein n=1 Tax=Rhizobium meliloti TaxID=382 RepID=UPI0019143097|nr:hypothetical protein [Sinorhizobium meliloti]